MAQSDIEENSLENFLHKCSVGFVRFREVVIILVDKIVYKKGKPRAVLGFV